MKKQTIKKHIFWADWGTFYGSTMVCCNFADYADVKRLLKKKKIMEWHDALDVKSEEFKAHHFLKWYVIDQRTNKEVSYSLLWLKDWKQDVEHYKVLAHELVHAMQFNMPEFLDVTKEYEAVAYQHSYLFENIAKELNKIYK